MIRIQTCKLTTGTQLLNVWLPKSVRAATLVMLLECRRGQQGQCSQKALTLDVFVEYFSHDARHIIIEIGRLTLKSIYEAEVS